MSRNRPTYATTGGKGGFRGTASENRDGVIGSKNGLNPRHEENAKKLKKNPLPSYPTTDAEDCNSSWDEASDKGGYHKHKGLKGEWKSHESIGDGTECENDPDCSIGIRKPLKPDDEKGFKSILFNLQEQVLNTKFKTKLDNFISIFAGRHSKISRAGLNPLKFTAMRTKVPSKLAGPGGRVSLESIKEDPKAKIYLPNHVLQIMRAIQTRNKSTDPATARSKFNLALRDATIIVVNALDKENIFRSSATHKFYQDLFNKHLGIEHKASIEAIKSILSDKILQLTNNYLAAPNDKIIQAELKTYKKIYSFITRKGNNNKNLFLFKALQLVQKIGKRHPLIKLDIYEVLVFNKPSVSQKKSQKENFASVVDDKAVVSLEESDNENASDSEFSNTTQQRKKTKPIDIRSKDESSSESVDDTLAISLEESISEETSFDPGFGKKIPLSKTCSVNLKPMINGMGLFSQQQTRTSPPIPTINPIILGKSVR